MSFWGATVITSLASALPLVGESIVTWLWGGFSVDNATLNRFFSLHYLLPFALVALSGAHLAALHQYGSNNPLGVNGDKLTLYPYYFVKDFVGWLLFAFLLCLLVLYSPNALGHPDNSICANPSQQGRGFAPGSSANESPQQLFFDIIHDSQHLLILFYVKRLRSSCNYLWPASYPTQVSRTSVLLFVDRCYVIDNFENGRYSPRTVFPENETLSTT